MTDHPVKRKLRNEILPWLESAKLLRKQWFHRTYVFFGYTTDITVALGGFGVSVPLLTVLTQPDKDNTPPSSLSTLLPSDPVWLYYAAVLAVFAWVFLRVAFNREEGQKRAVLARSCAQTMKQMETKLYRVLALADPMPELNKMLDEQIGPVIDRNIQEGSYPWSGPAPGISGLVDARLVELSNQFESNWTAVDPAGLRK